MALARRRIQKHATIVAPSDEVKEDILLLLNRIEGCESEWYNITTAEELNKEWFIKAVPTKHTRPLYGKCFGYQLNVDGSNIVYTGDTATLAPFVPLLTKGSFLYSEAASFRSDVHIFLEDTLPIFNDLINKGISVYLMHLDREDVVKEIIKGTQINLAPLYKNE